MKIYPLCNDCMNICDHLFPSPLWQCFDSYQPDPSQHTTDLQAITVLQNKLQDTITELNDAMCSLDQVTTELKETSVEVEAYKSQIQTLSDDHEDHEDTLTTSDTIRLLNTEHKRDLVESSIEVEVYRNQLRKVVKDHYTNLKESSSYMDKIRELHEENIKLQKLIDNFKNTSFSKQTINISLPALIRRKKS